MRLVPLLVRRRFLAATALTLLAGCVVRPPEPAGLLVPARVIPIGAGRDDVVGLLGPPARGPVFDRYSNLSEMVYSFPFPAIRGETRFPDGTTRVEMVDRIHLFFDRKNKLDRMAYRTDRYYPSVTDLRIDQITILPHRIDPDGRVLPLVAQP
ncbi:hypothetical protein [Azospirillum sp. SYSU D00513]|uniref:hypothetical protein n=1 Tax=Azospirillum sp. SYSU D00513 TaxID=2812561 RepID=UPI001A9771A3|nr:hypothetical protein [Azospirillum sp. SYSU D00513]